MDGKERQSSGTLTGGWPSRLSLVEESLEYTCSRLALPLMTSASTPRETIDPMTTGSAPASLEKVKDAPPCGPSTFSLCSPAGILSRAHCPSRNSVGG